MAYKQPRVPPMKEGAKIAEYIRELILFLKDFCLETWKAVTQMQRDAAGDRVSSVNKKTGEVTLDAADVGALPSDGTAKNSAQLGGVDASQYALKKEIPEIPEQESFDILSVYPVGAIYMSTVNTSPAALFGGWWEQLYDRFLIGAGSGYAVGSIGGTTSYALRANIGACNDYPAALGYYAAGTTAYQAYHNATYVVNGEGNGSFKKWNHSTPVTTTDGTSDTTTIVPPYYAVYMWRRLG